MEEVKTRTIFQYKKQRKKWQYEIDILDKTLQKQTEFTKINQFDKIDKNEKLEKGAKLY